jgi:hypothetical protein
MTGHQPGIFHPGIVYKYEITDQFARAHQATAIAITMDLDTGDAGQFLVPQPADAHASAQKWPVAGTRAESLVNDGSLYHDQKLPLVGDLDELVRSVDHRLRACQVSHAADRFSTVMASYRQLAGVSAVMANSIVRRAHDLAPSMLELPLSTLCSLPDVQAWLAQVARDGEAFHRAYNETLAAWRKRRKLRSPAHPFPDLDRAGVRFELPLWRIDLSRQARHAVWAELGVGRIELSAGSERFATLDLEATPANLEPNGNTILAPRGALITVLFRMLCSDLFVHGLGGQTYDHYTDTLIERYFGVAPLAFSVASASRYLFDSQRERLMQWERFVAHQRELEHHPENYLGQGWFSPEVEQRLGIWVEQKEQLVAALREKKQRGVSAADEGRRLQALREQMKACVAAALAERFGDLKGPSQAVHEAIESRDYPWFYFSPAHQTQDSPPHLP